MRTAARVTLFALASSLGLGTLRVTASAEPARAANDRPNGSDRGGPALREIGEEIARSAFGLAPGAAVIGLAPTTPNLGPGIAVRLAVRVALALGNGAAAWPYVETERHAIALPHGARPLVLLTPRLDGDRLVVTAEVIGPETPGAAQKLLHGIATRALDAEVRSFLPAVRLAAREIIPLSGADSDVLALACSDVLGRGDPVLATLGRAR
ncbi:MAG TPA: hypothetical protein VGQ57_11110, partial [Polyangiaceae bacterium]|nr:hypothetical protein [Polyangiaceae bacterium]